MGGPLKRFTLSLGCWLLAAALLAGMPCAPALAQSADKAQSPKVEQLLDLLGDADIQEWIKVQRAATPAPAKPASAGPVQDLTFAGFITRFRTHLSDLVSAIPRLPDEIAGAMQQIGSEMSSRGPVGIIVLLAVFVGVGLAAQWLFWRGSRRWRDAIAGLPLATVRERVIAIAARFLLSAGYVVAFALGSIGAFLAFDWPPLLRNIVVGYLTAVVVLRLARVMLEFLLSPASSRIFGKAERFRIIPVAEDAAMFWTRRLSLAVGWFAFGWITVRLLAELGVSRPAQQLVAYALGLVLLAIGVAAIYQRPAGDALADAEGRRFSRHRAGTWLWSIYFSGLWLLWVSGAMRGFWLAVVAVGLPFAARLTQKAVNNVLRPAGMEQGGTEIPGVLAAVIERGIRASLIIAAVVFLAWGWGVDLTAMAAQDTFAMRLIRGAFSAIVIALVADFIWHIGKTVIDLRISEASSAGDPGTEEARRRARIRTLLPILRNVLFVIVATVAVMMILSSLGVEIGPLIAGAGVVGVAVGFGAQSVVKDIISGVFYLLDDAFRVGEYIESGSFKGTVESFSLRSVKLRHHRGALYTIPFSELGTVQNQSRDWVIDKVTMTVTYDSDVDKARKIVKKIGLELAEDPEFKASIIEPLKMQGIDSFGDSGIVLRMKLKTRPGEQFGIKRRALMMIKSAFDENGIKLAFPTVQIAGSGDGAIAAAAQQALAKQKAAQETAT